MTSGGYRPTWTGKVLAGSLSLRFLVLPRRPSVARPAVHQVVPIYVATGPGTQVRVAGYFRPSGPPDWLTRATSATITGSASVRLQVATAFGTSKVKVAVDVTGNGSSEHCATIFTPKSPKYPVAVSEWLRHPRDTTLETAKDHAAVVSPEAKRVGQHHVHVQGAGFADDDV
jgi:hypothetical protein